MKKCSELLPHVRFTECQTKPKEIFTDQCTICGCISNHNGYVGICNREDPLGCTACAKVHPNELCNLSDLISSVFDETYKVQVKVCLVEIHVSIYNRRITWADRIDN